MSLDSLPIELQQLVVSGLLDPCDCARLCLAHPRIGLEAQQRFAQYQGPIFCVALRLVLAPRRSARLAHRVRSAFAIDEPLLRRYAVDATFSHEGCQWLLAAGVGLGTGLRLECRSVTDGEERRLYDGDVRGALVAHSDQNNQIFQYEGELGAEKVVRVELQSGSMLYCEGERGVERMVRAEWPNGREQHYEGERNAERCVMTVWSDGVREHYEGEKGAERVVRADWPDDDEVHHFEGEYGAEWLVRVEKPDGEKQHFAGKRGEERLVLAVRPDGVIEHYDVNEMGEERLVREDWPNGLVMHFEGEPGALQVVRTELPEPDAESEVQLFSSFLDAQ